MIIDEEMTMEEIESRFDSEWVLINDPVVDEQNRVIRGRVRFHGADKGEMHEAVKQVGADVIATYFIGDPPEGMQFLL